MGKALQKTCNMHSFESLVWAPFGRLSRSASAVNASMYSLKYCVQQEFPLRANIMSIMGLVRAPNFLLHTTQMSFQHPSKTWKSMSNCAADDAGPKKMPQSLRSLGEASTTTKKRFQISEASSAPLASYTKKNPQTLRNHRKYR